MRPGAFLVELRLSDLPVFVAFEQTGHGLLERAHFMLGQPLNHGLALLVFPHTQVLPGGVQQIIHALIVNLDVGNLQRPGLQLFILRRI